ncbi:MAG: hypothetical protein ABSB24_11120 [Gaiellaceae bacterium]|jgi:hypothetical protein
MAVQEITAVTGDVTGLRCAQCDRPAPTDPDLLHAWRHSELITSPVDELIVKMLLCPACLEDDHTGDFESEAGD